LWFTGKRRYPPYFNRKGIVFLGQEKLDVKVNAIERKHNAQRKKLEHRQEALKERLLRVTRTNTETLIKIAGLSARQFELERRLGTGLKHGGTALIDSAPTVRIELEERNRLVALVKLQGREIDALKAEINLLRRKGGYVYVPANSAPSSNGHALPSVEGTIL